MAEETLLEWAGKQPNWVRDALRRYATSGAASLSEDDKAEILARVRHHSGFAADAEPVCQPISVAHLGTSEGAQQAILCSFGPVENLNRLAPNQKLMFATNGLTLIYGDNGSGKSGYARIAKKLCRSLTSADLLGNVFEPGAKPPATVNVRYRLAGSQQVIETTWTDGTSPPAEIAHISVFDSQNARLYVDQENRISFLPNDIALLQRHGEQCAAMDVAFQEEINAIERRVKIPLPTGYTQGGEVANMLARLALKINLPIPTAGDIAKAGSWTDADVAELERLEKSLAHDPAVLAARSRRAIAALETLASSMSEVEVAMSTEAGAKLEALRTRERLASEAASLAASDKFSAEPLAGVGLSAWRLMYDYAKAYVTSIGAGGDRLPDAVGDRCPLCQEPLSPEGAARIREFNDFVASEAAKSADAARLLREEAVNAVLALSVQTPMQVTQLLAEYAAIDATRRELQQNITQYFASVSVRRNALVSSETPEEFAAVPSLEASLVPKVLADIEALRSEATAFEAAAEQDTGRAAERTQLAALRDRKKLSEDLVIVLARRDDLEQIAKLKACCATVERGHISRQITSLRRSLVMRNLERRILDEIAALDLTHIPFEVSDRSRNGQSYFGVALQSPESVANAKVLSEGEQRALALACFLGENATDEKKSGMIIDDPVSSLDLTRLRRVAIRLVEEAKGGRQVIIFTHNILFFKEVEDAAGRASPQVPVLKNYVRSSKADGFGVISNIDEPWVMLPVTKRISILRARHKVLENTTNFDTEEWRAKAKDFYTDLRETWERLVEEVLLGKVVERFNTDVKTQSLKCVVVEDEDYRQVFWAMKKVSERSGHDMALGKALPVPTPFDMKDDLEEIDAFRSAIHKRKDEAEKRRKKLENPPAAEVA